TAQVRLSVRVVCLLPVVLVGLLLIISPDFQKGVAPPAGLISLGLACCMDVAAVLIVRHLSRGIL
ncbi:MAG TPA: type II secretion system protein, partial [Atopobiaceae bacterium]|nr:type II secretion system protein [Atopobiaceae bacterium]